MSELAQESALKLCVAIDTPRRAFLWTTDVSIALAGIIGRQSDWENDD
jgi:hypothetical protein